MKSHMNIDYNKVPWSSKLPIDLFDMQESRHTLQYKIY